MTLEGQLYNLASYINWHLHLCNSIAISVGFHFNILESPFGLLIKCSDGDLIFFTLLIVIDDSNT